MHVHRQVTVLADVLQNNVQRKHILQQKRMMITWYEYNTSLFK
jgi:hypothetical protein